MQERKSISKKTGVHSVLSTERSGNTKMHPMKPQLQPGFKPLQPVQSIRVNGKNEVTHINGLQIEHH